jgi:hypothetical protein
MRKIGVLLLGVAAACGNSPSNGNIDARPGGGRADAAPGTPDAAPGTPDARPAPTADAAPSGNLPAGWLYTAGSQIYVADGSGGGSAWMGRGVNTDDVFLCGYNYMLGDSGEVELDAMMDHLVSDWHATFVRMSLSMSSGYGDESWIGTSGYKTSMENVINRLTGMGVYVLVTLRSDTTMDGTHGDEATFIPTSATDPVYEAIVDSFQAHDHVLFGLSNEPGGSYFTTDIPSLVAAMSHAVGTIRAEEDRLSAHHHLVSVQGNDWTSDISFYDSSPLTYDDVVYEVHGYPPASNTYTYSNIPVIIGEYGEEYTDAFDSTDATNAAALQADFEAKGLPNAAWDYEPYSDCSPDLLVVDPPNVSRTASAWGDAVRTYLRAH